MAENEVEILSKYLIWQLRLDIKDDLQLSPNEFADKINASIDNSSYSCSSCSSCGSCSSCSE